MAEVTPTDHKTTQYGGLNCEQYTRHSTHNNGAINMAPTHVFVKTTLTKRRKSGTGIFVFTLNAVSFLLKSLMMFKVSLMGTLNICVE